MTSLWATVPEHGNPLWHGNCEVQMCNTSILITQSEMGTTTTAQWISLEVHFTRWFQLPFLTEKRQTLLAGFDALPSMGIGRVELGFLYPTDPYSLGPCFPHLPGLVYMAFSTFWGQEDLGSTLIIFLLKAPEVRVGGKAGIRECRGRQLFHVNKQDTLAFGPKQLPTWWSTKGTCNVISAPRDHPSQGHHYRHPCMALRKPGLSTHTHTAFLLGWRSCCPKAVMNPCVQVNGAGTVAIACLNHASLFSAPLMGRTVGILIPSCPPSPWWEHLLVDPREFFHIPKLMSWVLFLLSESYVSPFAPGIWSGIWGYPTDRVLI